MVWTLESGQGMKSAVLTGHGIHQKRALWQSVAPFPSRHRPSSASGLLVGKQLEEGVSSLGLSMWKEGQISPWRPFLEQGRG